MYLAEISVSAPEGGSCGTSSPRKGTLFRVIGTLEYNNKDDVEDILNTLAVVAERKHWAPTEWTFYFLPPPQMITVLKREIFGHVGLFLLSTTYSTLQCV